MTLSTGALTGWEIRHGRPKAKATDLETSEYPECETRLSLRMRNSVIVGIPSPRRSMFPLGAFVDAVDAYHRVLRTGQEHDAALVRARRRYDALHPGWRRFLDHAIDVYVDLHEDRESLLSKPLRYVGAHIDGAAEESLPAYAWGLLYESDDGYREVRRIRISKPRTEYTEWAAIAARAAADFEGRPASTVSVIEFALATGLETVIIESASADEAVEGFQRVLDRARTVFRASTRTPCSNCTDCKALQVCDAPIPMRGVLGQSNVGPWPRTLSQQDLVAYRRCPAQWYLQYDSKLPREDVDSDTTARDMGIDVHAWLAEAHRRAMSCTIDDLPDGRDRTSTDIAADTIDDDRYAAILPMLREHLAHCRAGEDDLLVIEETLHGYDPSADVVVAAKPDLLARRERTLVVREVKTTSKPLPATTAEARDQFDDVVYWLLSLADGGWRQYFDCDDVVVELEVLRGDKSALFVYHSSDAELMELAGYRMDDRVTDWHSDTTWRARPGAICSFCPVARWCPDAGTGASPTSTFDAPDDEPPF